MRLLKLFALGLFACVFSAGCASEYARSYRSSLGTPAPATAQYGSMNLVAFAGTPRIVQSSLSRQEQIQYLEEGFVPLGESRFYAPLESDKALLAQARKVGAELVLLGRNLGQTMVGATPYTTYEPVTIYHYGYRGRGRGYETAFVPQTNYMTYTENWYHQHAIFFTRRVQPPSLGALPRDLTGEERKKIGSNVGVIVICCVRGTPAWNAGLVPDDVIVSLAGQGVSDVEGLRKLVQQNAGKTVALEYLRNGEKRSVSVSLNPGSSGE